MYPHRLAPSGGAAMGFRLEAEALFDGSGGGGGGGGGAALSLLPLPGGLANGGADLLATLGDAVGALRAGLAPSAERVEDGKPMLAQLDGRAIGARRQASARVLQARQRGHLQRKVRNRGSRS